MGYLETARQKHALYSDLIKIAGEDSVLLDEPMCRHTSFRIGGPADFFVMPRDEQSLIRILQFCREKGIPDYIMGNGSNLLVMDNGYRGLIIQLFKNFSAITIDGLRIRAQAGAMLTGIAKCAQRESLTGMEFASGIPGTLGGAAVMNAGAYGGEMKDITETVRILDPESGVRELPCAQMNFGYRTSIVAEKGYIVLGAVLKLEKGDLSQITGRMEELKEARTSKQPLELPSAGSTFKRPKDHFAGKLIMEAGLRGYRVGGAMVSDKHCGFVVNAGNATALDVLTLMKDVQDKVFSQTGIKLEPEVKMLGEQQDVIFR